MSDTLDDQVAKENHVASIEFLKLGLKGCFIANGGSVIALLTYIGNSHADVHPLIEAAKQAMPDFIHGVLLSVIALFLACLAYTARYQHEYLKLSNLKFVKQATKTLNKLRNYFSDDPDPAKQIDLKKPLSFIYTMGWSLARWASFAFGIWSALEFIHGTTLALMAFK